MEKSTELQYGEDSNVPLEVQDILNAVNSEGRHIFVYNEAGRIKINKGIHPDEYVAKIEKISSKLTKIRVW